MRYVLSAIINLVILLLFTSCGESGQDDIGREKVMNQLVESKVVQKFREHLSQGNLDGVNLINRVSGGMPGEGRIEEELYISGKNEVSLRANATGLPTEDTVSGLDPDLVKSLFEKIGKGIDSLVPRSKAQFVPDSVVGSITIDVAGEQATFYYLADEDDRAMHETPLNQEMSDALIDIKTLSKQLRKPEEN